jgi:hypothetical protein
MNAIIRDFQIFLGFLAAIFAFSIKGDSGSNDPFNVQVVITFVPYLFFAFSFFFLIKMANLMTNAAYVRDIENRINTLLGSNVLNWESSITQKLLFDFRTPFVISATLFSMLLLAGYGLACILGYFRFIPEIPLLKDYRCVFLSIYIACPIILGLFLWWIIWGSKKLPERIVVLVGKVKPFNTLPPDPDSLKGGCE